LLWRKVPGQAFESRGKTEAETVQFSLRVPGHPVFQRERDLADFADLGPNQGRQAIQVFCGDIFDGAFAQFSFQPVELFF
jgi:hypothetical protein